MRSIIITTCHPPPISPSVIPFPYTKTKHHFNSTKPVFHTKTTTRHLQWRNRLDAVPATLFIAATNPPYSGDLSVLFQTSAVMLFMYWITNFVVPAFIMKDLQGDEATGDEKKGDENLPDNGQGSTPRSSAGSGTNKRGFGDTKQ